MCPASLPRRETGAKTEGTGPLVSLETTPRGRPGYSRADVIRIAVEEFNAHGYEATSMGKLAQRLGLTKSAIYHHVTSKEEILAEATNDALTKLIQVFDDLPETESAYDRLQALIVGASIVLCDNTDEVTLLLRLRGNTEVEVDILHRRREITRRFLDLVKAAQKERTVRTDIDPGVAARLVLGTINSITEWYRPDGPNTAEQLAKMVAGLVMDGLSQPAS